MSHPFSVVVSPADFTAETRLKTPRHDTARPAPHVLRSRTVKKKRTLVVTFRLSQINSRNGANVKP